jgi:hypothetical protein
MNPIEPQKKPDWLITALSILLAVLVLGFTGLLLTGVIQDWLGKEPIFPLDWSFVLFGMLLLVGESFQLTRRILTEGPDSSNLTVAIGLIAIGLFTVAPGMVLKIVFGILIFLSILLTGIAALKGKKTK